MAGLALCKYLLSENGRRQILTLFGDPCGKILFRDRHNRGVHAGVLRSAVRVEVRVATPSLWFADAFTRIEGEEVQIQSYRFTKG